MTRFWITLEQGVRFVLESLERMQGGEIFVPKIPSMRMVDLAKAMAPDAALRTVGIRAGEKLHEEMVSVSDARSTRDLGDRYVILPHGDGEGLDLASGEAVSDGFSYASNTNDRWLSVDELRAMVADA